MGQSTFAGLLYLLGSFAAADTEQNSEICPESMPQLMFGPRCLYPCHCQFYDQCNARSGNCGLGGCKEGYTGTSCQYVTAANRPTLEDRFSAFPGESGREKLVDGNLDSCFEEDGKSGEPLSIRLNPVTWADVITVHLNKSETASTPADDLHLTYSLSNSTPTVPDPPQVDPSGLLLKYRLPKPALVSQVQIRVVNNATLAICEIIVSSVTAGRNIAVARNGSDVITDGSSSTCAKAVSDAAGRSTWKVSFGHDVVVWRVRLTTEGGAAPNVSMNVTNGDGSEKEVQVTPVGDGDLLLAEPEMAGSVTLWTNGQHPDLCEVAVFGDCPDGNFGPQCENVCNCGSSGEICDKLLGGCPSKQCKHGFTGDDCWSKCPEGHFGAGCQDPCPTNCRNKQCDHVTGACVGGCRDSWQGDQCAECPEGHFGAGCQDPCPTNCRNKQCDHVTGACVGGCTDSWQGDQCAECADGYYGDGCTEPCPDNCLNKECNNVTGACSQGCKDGWTGDRCAECADGYYGDGCTEPCPDNCWIQECNNVTGACSRVCKDGWTGDRCAELCSATMPQEWFGPDCLLPCRCTYYDECNATSGNCGSGTCKSGYIGTSCQYVNAAYNATVNATFSIFGPNKLVDGMLKECSVEDGESGMPLSVYLKQATWADVITVRLHKEFREEGNISTAADLELTYYSHGNGTQSTKLVPQVDPADLDFITFRLLKPSLVSRVQIRAVNSARLALCEISVSSGRNMAVKRGSGVVTDGNSSTCTKAVSDAAGRSTWKVSFGHEVVVWRVGLTTKGGAKAANISVNVTFSDGSEKEVQFTPMEDGDLQLTRPEKVVNVTLWSLRQLPDLCEVAVFGDCPDGKFGPQCEHVCDCESSSLICDKLLGDCPSKQCQAGQDCSPKCTDGRNCNESCSTNCRTNKCNVNGTCSEGCKHRWSGEKCAECMSGFYGKDCTQVCSSRICKNNDCSDNCSPQCREMCNAASGACKMLGVFTMIAVFLTFL